MAIIRYVGPSGNNANSGQASGQAWATVAFAKQQVRDLVAANPAEDIHVILLGGLHAITETLAFTELDSPAAGNRVVWRAASGVTPVISGGVEVDTWTLHDAEKSIWVADYAGPEFRQLYVDDLRCKRARRTTGLINGTFTSSGFTTTDPVTNYGNVSDVELIFQYDWRQSRVKVASAVANTSLTMVEPAQARYVALGNLTASRMPVAIENAYEILEAATAATFYWDRTAEKIYLVPPAGVSDPNESTVIVPTIEKLATFDGASRIDFRGIQWAHNTWLPADGGFADVQSMVIMDGTNTNFQQVDNYGQLTPAAIELRDSNDITFSDGSMVRLGSHAVAVLDDSDRITIAGNVIADNSGHGVVIGRPGNQTLGNPASRVTVHNNLVAYCGQDYPSCNGICLIFGRECDIANNDVMEMPYTGIGTGWGWGNIKQHNLSPNIYNRVRRNKVHNVMLKMLDGAGYYNVGTSSGLVVEENYIFGVQTGVAFYFDAGSIDVTFQNNLVYAYCPYWLQYHQGFGDFTVEGNHAYYEVEPPAYAPWTDAFDPMVIPPAGAVQWEYEGPTIYQAEAPTPAQALIVANAGLEPNYRSLTAPTIPPATSLWSANAIGDEAGWWLPSERTDGTVPDKIGSNHMGGTRVLVDDAAAGGRKALLFDGTDDSATLTAPTDNTSVAWSFWFYKPAGDQSGAIFRQGDNAGTVALGFGTTYMDVDGGNLILLNETFYWVTGTHALTTGWHHCVVSIDSASTAYVYIDGALVITDGQGTISAPSGTVRFGGYGTRFAHTMIDDIRYFTRDLTLGEIALLAGRRGGDEPEALVWSANAIGDEAGWWLPSERTDSTVPDKIGSNNMGGTLVLVTNTDEGGARALSFDGVDDAATLTAYTDNTSVAWSFWFYKPAGNQSGAIFRQGDNDFTIALGIGATTLDADGSNLVLSGEGSYWVTGTHALTTGWHHCVVSIDSTSTAYIYIDGALVITDGQGTISAPSGTVRFGGYGTRFANVLIDDIRYFARDLTLGEVAQLAGRRGGDE
jgi:hypothetical protein